MIKIDLRTINEIHLHMDSVRLKLYSMQSNDNACHGGEHYNIPATNV